MSTPDVNKAGKAYKTKVPRKTERHDDSSNVKQKAKASSRKAREHEHFGASKKAWEAEPLPASSTEPGFKPDEGKKKKRPQYHSQPLFSVNDITMVREQIQAARSGKIAGDIATPSNAPSASSTMPSSRPPSRKPPPLPAMVRSTEPKPGDPDSGSGHASANSSPRSAEASPRSEEEYPRKSERRAVPLKPIEGKNIRRLRPDRLSPHSTQSTGKPAPSILPSVSHSYNAESVQEYDARINASLSATDRQVWSMLARKDSSLFFKSQQAVNSNKAQEASAIPGARKYFQDLCRAHESKLEKLGIKRTMDAVTLALPEHLLVTSKELERTLNTAIKQAQVEVVDRAIAVAAAQKLLRYDDYFGENDYANMMQLLVICTGRVWAGTLATHFADVAKVLSE